MRAARMHGHRDVRVDDVPVPTLAASADHPKDSWLGAPRALIQVEWCGICGSDLHMYEIAPMGFPTKDSPHPLTNTHLPSILGHELCGTVVEANSSDKFPNGTKVMVDPRLACHSLAPHGPCLNCDEGRDHQCPKTGFTGYSGAGGGFAEYVVVEEKYLHPLPENVGLESAALIEPLTVAHHALKLTGYPGNDWKGKSALIVGGGPVGYAVIVALRAAGCEKIVVSEPTKKRREVLLESGLVTAVINPREEDIGKKCYEVGGGRGVDAAFDCAGVQKGIEAAIASIKEFGWVIIVSMWETPVSVLLLELGLC
jgi:threonine dehydrogenase-like Zn-dependent dehydrogenase